MKTGSNKIYTSNPNLDPGEDLSGIFDFFSRFSPLPFTVINSGLEILYCNANMMSLVDFELKEGKNIFISELIDDPQNLINEAINKLNSGEPRTKIKNLFLKTTKIKIGIDIHKLKDQQKDVFLVIFHDAKTFESGFLTEFAHDPLIVKEYEEKIKKTKEQAELTDKLRLTFLKNLSYEIRSPMNGILGFSELLSQPGLSEEKITEYTNQIRNKGRYLYTLIDDVIEISQFEMGKISFTKSMVKLQPILNELFEEFESRRKKLHNNNITFVMSVPEGAEEQYIYTDAGRLHQLLSNLLSNALKFTVKGRIELGYKISEKYIKFYVKDTGPGLSKKDKQTIFNRFAQMEKKSMQKFSGTGLSLTISKHIVEQMGGKIKVKSELNKGSTFQISIPIKTPESYDPEELIEENKFRKVNWKNKVILIAEDDDSNFKFLEAIMQMTNARVLRASNGQQAIDLCHNISQIDIVLIDLKMPVIGGFDAIRSIKRIRPGLPVLVQTAYASQNEINQSKLVGADDFIPKPIDLNLLITKMEKLFVP